MKMPNTIKKALFLPFLFCKYCISHIEYLPPANFCVVLRGQHYQQKDSECMRTWGSGFYYYTAEILAAIHRSCYMKAWQALSTTQQQCYSEAVSASANHLFCPWFNKTANSGLKRGCLQLHLTAAREYCSKRPKSWDLFQTDSEAAKTCCSLNKLQQNFKVHKQNCLLGSSIRRGNRKTERDHKLADLFTLKLLTTLEHSFPGLLAHFKETL